MVEANSKGKISVKMMTRVAIMAVISVILMQVSTSLPVIAPKFMKLDISDMPGLITGFAMGPLAGVLVQLLKNLFDLVVSGTDTGGVGELSNFIIGSIFVISSCAVYRRNRTLKGAIIGLIVGVLCLTAGATLSNYFFIFPLYAKIMIPMDKIIKMGSAVNPAIKNLETFMLYAVVPFNIIKGSITAVITLLLYKRIKPILNR